MNLLIGKEKYEQFVKAYYKNYITEKDIALISSNGLNTIRLPFNYRLFSPGAIVDGYAVIDSVINWCAKYNVYIILDMHAAPGGQNNFFISDPEKPHLWNAQQRKDASIALWKNIALKYKNGVVIAGYDLLNEPDGKTGDVVAFIRILLML